MATVTFPDPVLLTEGDLNKLPMFEAIEDEGDSMAYVHWFAPDVGWDWYIMARTNDPDIFWCLTSGFEVECGGVSLSEITAARGKISLPVERDRCWTPRRVSRIRKELGHV